MSKAVALFFENAAHGGQRETGAHLNDTKMAIVTNVPHLEHGDRSQTIGAVHSPRQFCSISVTCFFNVRDFSRLCLPDDAIIVV